VAVHDVGKFSRNFQALAPSHWPSEALGALPPGGVVAGPRHDAMGLLLLNGPLAPLLDPVLPSGARRDAWDAALRAPLLRAVTGHHGRPPQDVSPPPSPTLLCAGCLAAATDFMGALQAVFSPVSIPCPDEDEIARWAWRLAGLVTLADWVGSRQAWFPYTQHESVADPDAYFWNQALPRAAAALAAAGITGSRPASYQGIRRLFPGITLPSPVQRWAADIALPPGPVLAVLEDLTGSGKTEAAVALAHRLMADGRSGGLFLALPTMATANAMFGRLAEAYHRLFVAEARPSLALAHGRAGLDVRFRASIPVDAVPYAVSADDPADESAESHCAAWLADDRRKALLAQVGVGTLDQALMAVLPVRHAALRLHGLAGKVLVVDEVHAFDPYMRRELLTLLEFHAALGGSAVLLSATLPRKMRAELVQAYRRGLGVAPSRVEGISYPLATLVSGSGLIETPCAPREGLPRRVSVARLADAAAAIDRVATAGRMGAAVAWIRNTVDDAISAAALLREHGIEAIIFHARFAMVDRLAIETEVLRRFGRDSTSATRKGVLVATQVIEQSLDLDFDVMVTDLAPVDLLIQRAGRLWRHRRDGRAGTPELCVVSPEPVDVPPTDWIARTQPGTAVVYRDPALLWRSARALFRRGAISTPNDMRPLIEEVYDDTAADAVPPAFASMAALAIGRNHAATGVARQNLLKLGFSNAYVRGDGKWEPDTRTPTRLEDQPQVTLRLALLRDGVVVPYAQADDPALAWALSEVRVAADRVEQAPLAPALEAAAASARDNWTPWEREAGTIQLVVLDQFKDGVHTALHANSAGAAIRYAPTAGVLLQREQSPILDLTPQQKA
jgi:CRISPR-associated endonuclease/helicase Cas3